MLISLLETKNLVTGEALQLLQEADEERYHLWKGKYDPGQTEMARWENKGEYDNLSQALAVYLANITTLIK